MITAGEYFELSNSDPVRIARIAAARERANEYAMARIALQAPVLQKLNEVGIKASSLLNMRDKVDYSVGLPILLDALRNSDQRELRYELALCFTCAAAKPYWADLVQLFRSETDQHVAEGLANALTELVDSSRVQDVVDLVVDNSIGAARVILLGFCTRYAAVAELLPALVDDPLLGKVATRKLREKARRQARK